MPTLVIITATRLYRMSAALVMFGGGPVEFTMNTGAVPILEACRLVKPEEIIVISDIQDTVGFGELLPSWTPGAQHRMALVLADTPRFA